MNDKDIKYDVIISNTADKMLYEHLDFLSNVSPYATTKLIDQLNKIFESLTVMPYKYSIYASTNSDNNYRRVVVGRYAILYIIYEDIKRVEIVYILDTRRFYNL